MFRGRRITQQAARTGVSRGATSRKDGVLLLQGVGIFAMAFSGEVKIVRGCCEPPYLAIKQDIRYARRLRRPEIDRLASPTC